ncbi:MAG: hypothetical protein FWG72_07965 [Oscillospiraceae bacterium]|nr:hypothetical protein [Oscillospiraceae bacterium]
MNEKKSFAPAWIVIPTVVPALLLCVLSLSIVLFRFLTDAAWTGVLEQIAVALAAANPGALPILALLLAAVRKAVGGYMVREAVTMEGVGRETLDRSAAIAEGKSGHPIAACLRDFCGDVAAPPDKYVEMEGLGVSAQFSGQMIHAGNAGYMRGLKVEAPDVPGKTVFIALEGRLLGYYRLLGPKETDWLRSRLTVAIAVCAGFKIAVWVLAALAGTANLPLFVGLETLSLIFGLAAARRLIDSPGASPQSPSRPGADVRK